MIDTTDSILTATPADEQRLRAIRRDLHDARMVVESVDALAVLAVTDLVAPAVRRGNTLYAFGNGGSAAIAQHLAAEFVGHYRRHRPPLRAVALTTDTSILTALVNDYGAATVFARQVEAHAREGDVALGMSAGGTSHNIVLGLQAATARGCATIALVGDPDGPVGAAANLVVGYPNVEIGHVQEAHLVFLHALVAAVEAALA